jgi:nitrate/nitrite transport system substrate-binding protein
LAGVLSVATPFFMAAPATAGASTEGLMDDAQQQPGDGTARPAPAWAAGSDAPEKATVRIGFIPLSDCASVVMASVLQFDRKHGLRIVPTRETSWAGVRDKLLGGELDLAHALYGLVYGLHLGVGGPKRDMAVLMTLNRNGQGITLSRRLAERGATGLDGLAALMRRAPREYTFAQTFPTGTHAMWLYYWLASAGVHPFEDVRNTVVPPPQMVTGMRLGAMDGFSAGEPWNHRAIADGVGVTAATSQDVWPDHPEKVLGGTADFVERHPNTARAVIAAVLEASRWIDASPANRQRAAEVLAGADYLDTPVETIAPRLQGRYDNGMGRQWDDPHRMRFFDDGAVNYPYLSDGMWFLTQHKRWGLLPQHPDYLGVARQINRIDLYVQAAGTLQIGLPAQPMRRSRLIDGSVWDGSAPQAYADGFALRRRLPQPA